MPTCSEKVQGAFYRHFHRWGGIVARKPYQTISAAVVISFLLSLNLFVGEVREEVEQDKLWVPQESEGVDAKKKYEALYGTQYRRNSFIFTTSPPGGNVLTAAVLQEVARFETAALTKVYAWEGRRGSLDAGNVSYASLCPRPGIGADHAATSAAGCISAFNDPLELWKKADGTYDLSHTDAQILATANSGIGVDSTLFPPGRTVSVDRTFGGIVRDASGQITSAKALQLFITLADYKQGGPNPNPNPALT